MSHDERDIVSRDVKNQVMSPDMWEVELNSRVRHIEQG